MIVMNYTLQFLPPGKRSEVIGRIADALLPGGVFLLSEKVIHDDPAIESTLTALYYEFKRRHHYSELEISRKRQALENVLIPETEAKHFERLTNAGFAHVGVWLRYFNFISLLAVK